MTLYMNFQVSLLNYIFKKYKAGINLFFDKFVLLKKVKKKNLYDQSIFASDTSRQTYYVKTRISDDISEWKIDKCGVIVNELVIKPLVEIVKKTIVDFDNSLKPEHDISPDDTRNFLKIKDANYRFIVFLEDGKLNAKINKYLCPLLVMDFDKVRSLKETKRSVPTLEYEEKPKQCNKDESNNKSKSKKVKKNNL